jgi:hypothetical protein
MSEVRSRAAWGLAITIATALASAGAIFIGIAWWLS